jgi:hypothetical protein
MTMRAISPTAPLPLLPRDADALTRIGRFRMLTRSQLHRWHFPTVSDTVVRRFVNRMTARGYLGTERLNGNGRQVLWLTPKGADVLVDETRVDRADLFPARGPVPPKDFAHTTAIIDAAIAVEQRGLASDMLLPAWALQRAFAGRINSVPDLLCLTRSSGTQAGVVLAVEVDLGNEPIRSMIVPKARRVVLDVLAPYRRSTVALLLLTRGRRRREAIAAAVASIALSVPIVTELHEHFCAVPSSTTNVRSGCWVDRTSEGVEVVDGTAALPRAEGAD